ncbi:SCP-2 sterol transfer family protein [Mycolicibacterium rhodesiae]|uniref:SCP-2 sterol transfer family protein n=1 Tax=Mycolicibacterium rhodesiae TaxID=36814 RepID=A0A1X0J588_MYCRH|nr:SCP-2 sterol transfer family protein [Mycolicibacterium rhodesiae]MCV7347951.1 SCP-2 sterol transfer family protein [Mycolicibacterium rhodesiae]ORB57248.1 SCP-2 sterol transfer family protein [Mycolicibacterium rhodesiae]
MAEQVSALFRRSVDHLADDMPASYRLLVAELGPLIVELDVGDDIFSVHAGDERLQVTDGPAQAAGVRIRTSRMTILDLIDAKVGLDEAVEAGAVSVHGCLDDVQRAHDTLLAYIHGSVRAASVPALLSELRAGAP